MDPNIRIRTLEGLLETAKMAMLGDINPRVKYGETDIFDNWIADFEAIEPHLGDCAHCDTPLNVNFRTGRAYDYCPCCGWESTPCNRVEISWITKEKRKAILDARKRTAEDHLSYWSRQFADGGDTQAELARRMAMKTLSDISDQIRKIEEENFPGQRDDAAELFTY